MIFNEGYYTPMDRNYGVINTPDSVAEENIQVPQTIDPERKKFGISHDDIGIGVVAMQPGAEVLKARIWGGASKVEIGFMGSGKGSGQNLTPGSFSQEDREALRDLARINKVETSTHATVAINGLSGFNRQEFSEEARKQTLDEIRRAIDFAADATSGGGVVVHTGEYPRAMTSIKDKAGKSMFKGHLKEDKQATEYLVDSHTGRLISAVREDEVVWKPVEVKERNENGKEVIKYMRNEKGELIKDDMIESYKKEFPDNKLFQHIHSEIPEYKQDAEGNIITEKYTFGDFKEKLKKEEGISDPKEAAKRFFIFQNEAEIQRALGSARQFEEYYVDGMKERQKVIKAYKTYEEIVKNTPEDERWKLNLSIPAVLQERFGLIPPENKAPDKYLQELLKEIDKKIAYGRESSLSGRLQARQIQDRIRYTDTVENYGKEKTSESIANAAIYAMKRTESENRKRKELGIENVKPIFISPENLFPETYGSTPEEIGRIVKNAQDKMKEDLWDSKENKSKMAGVTSAAEAEKKAKEHIKATVDIGHLNIWRRFWNEDPNKTVEDNDKAFQDYIVKELKSLVDKKLVGNIHLHDNFGDHDEHLEIGRGSAPIEGILKVLKEGGLEKNIVVEVNGQNLNTTLPHAWAQLGSPIYAAGYRLPSGAPNQFDQIRGSYSGMLQSPFYIVGPYAPSEDWKLWSETPFE